MSNQFHDSDYHSIISSATSVISDKANNHNDISILNLSDVQNELRIHYQPIISASNGVKDLRIHLSQRANSLSTDLALEIKSITKNMSHADLTHDLVPEIGSKLFLKLKSLFDFPPFLLQHIVNSNLSIKQIQEGFRLKRLELSALIEDFRRLESTTLLVPDEKVFIYQSEADCDEFEKETKNLFTGQYLVDHDDIDINSEVFLKLMKKAIKPRLDEFIQSSQKQARLDYLAAYKLYSSELSKKNASQLRLASLKVEFENENNLEGVANAYESMISTILQQIKTLLIPYPVLGTLLNGQITIPTTQEVIIDPSTNLSLPGIYHILREQYGTDSFVSVSTHLLSLLQWQLSEDEAQKPLNAISQMDKVISTWVSKDLWSKINFDMFISFTLLKGLPQKFTGRKDLLRDINKFISDRDKKQTESSESTSFIDTPTVSRDDSSMPIYKKLNELIRTAVEDKKLSDTMNSKDPNKATIDQKRGTNPRFSPNSNTARIETAHNALDSATSKYTKLIDDFKSKLFDTEVLKSANIGIVTSPKSKPELKIPNLYCAVKLQSSVCPNCFPNGTTTTSGKCQPPCRDFLCNKCNLYGHMDRYCLQKKKADGTPIVK